MKRIFLLLLVAITMPVMAQDPYLNNSVINVSDVFGTSRYVSMGGAMGALGADISVISSNPAGIGLFTKNDVSLTAGASWLANNSAGQYSDGTFAQFNQLGAVVSFKGSGMVRNFNLAFNYQKKADYNSSFYGVVNTAASWADQLWGLSCEAYDNRNLLYPSNPDNFNNTLYALGDVSGLFDKVENEIVKGDNDKHSTIGVTRGSLSSYDINFSVNLNNRCYLGVTVGIDNVDFRRGTDYWEERMDVDGRILDFGYINEQVVSGNGYNLKFGAIVRPFESSPFRLGFTVETPTWFTLTYNDDQSLTTHYDLDKDNNLVYDARNTYDYYAYDLADAYINYLEYYLNTPWKVRVQMGSTISRNFAWGLEYEFANYSGTTMRFPSNYGGSVVDAGFKDMTRNQLKPQHTFRAGVEFKPTNSLSLRAGYNFISSTTYQDSYWDPFDADCSVAYPTGLDYMNLSDVHIITAGIGYRYRWLYADLAYKYRRQTGEYYAFNSEWSGLPNTSIPVDLSKHSITATIGVRF